MIFSLRRIIRSGKCSSPIHVVPISGNEAVGKQRCRLSNFEASGANGVSTGLGLSTTTYFGIPMMLQLDHYCFRCRVAAVENSWMHGVLEETHITLGKLLTIRTLRGTQTQAVAKSHDNDVGAMLRHIELRVSSQIEAANTVVFIFFE